MEYPTINVSSNYPNRVKRDGYNYHVMTLTPDKLNCIYILSEY